MKKLRTWISGMISFLLLTFLLFMGFVVISSKASGGQPTILGYQLKTVLSGSMEPGIQTGSVIAIKTGGEKDRFNKGDVITFKASESKLITHRVEKLEGKGNSLRYVTKGDYNDAPDPERVIPSNVVGEYTGFTVPYVGYGMNYAQSKEGAALLLVLPGLLLLIFSGITLWRAIQDIERQKDLPPS